MTIVARYVDTKGYTPLEAMLLIELQRFGAQVATVLEAAKNGEESKLAHPVAVELKEPRPDGVDWHVNEVVWYLSCQWLTTHERNALRQALDAAEFAA